ncbi:4-hydroxythreonine-4-phosphate dehydrogenase PdxA [Candidatus Omnitrophota bacterium]
MRISQLKSNHKPVAIVTMGYPAGIGPETIIKALASPKVRRLAFFLIIGDGSVFSKAAKLAKINLRYRVINTEEDINFSKSNILFFDMANLSKKNFKFSKFSANYGKASIDYISKAVSFLKKKMADILITGPIHKHAAQLSGFSFPGHTEYLASLTGTKDYAMMLTGGPLRVILATTHMPIKDVSKRLKKDRITKIISIANRALKSFGFKRPRIAVCGLNPHAGDGGLLGREDDAIIAPAIAAARRKGVKAKGPLAADAVFYDIMKGRFDAVVCMYHDQGLVALKMIARDTAVNVTLGLPFVRTSPGHGTALDIAGKGIADSDSMKEAILTAVSLFKRR